MAAAEMEKLKPKNETIQAVTVVPIFAPKMTPIACYRERISALTKLTTITVQALDDCMAAGFRQFQHLID